MATQQVDDFDGSIWFPELPERGDVVARAITDGPDADLGKLRWTLLAALFLGAHWFSRRRGGLT